METEFLSLTPIALILTIALLCGLALEKLKQPAIVGYILAGMVLGPTGIGILEEGQNVHMLAELGVLMLLFIIGLELDLKAFMSDLKISVLCAGMQILASVVICYGVGTALGWPLERVMLLAFVLSLSSTAVAVKMLEDTGEMKTQTGRIAIGVLVAQDLALIPMLVIVSSFGGESASLGIAFWGKIVFAVALLAGLVYLLSRKDEVHLPLMKWIENKADMIPVAGLGICFAASTVTGLLGLSAAYGAFLAGIVLAKSSVNNLMIKAVHPIQTVLLVMFFLMIGLMIDLKFILMNLPVVLFFLSLVIVIKTVLNISFLKFLGQKWTVAFSAGLVMAQLGEFSFVLTATGVKGGFLDDHFYKLCISVIALSLLLSPLWQISIGRIHHIAVNRVTDFKALLDLVYGRDIKAMKNFCSECKKKLQTKNNGDL